MRWLRQLQQSNEENIFGNWRGNIAAVYATKGTKNVDFDSCRGYRIRNCRRHLADKCFLEGIYVARMRITVVSMTTPDRYTGVQVLRHEVVEVEIYKFQIKVKVNLSLCLPKHHAMKTYLLLQVEVFWVVTPCSEVSDVTSPWRWRQNGHLKRWYPTTTLYGVTTHKTSTWNITAAEVSKLVSCLIKHHTMKTYWEVKVQLHQFLTLALDGGVLLASRPGHFTPVPIGHKAGHRINSPYSGSRLNRGNVNA